MHNRQHIDIGLRRDPVDNDIGQPDNRKLPRSGHQSLASEQRKLAEHHRRLRDSGDYIVGGAGIILRDPVPYCDQIIPRLRGEINVQCRGRAAALRPGSSPRGSAPAPAPPRPLRVSTPHGRDRAPRRPR